MLLWTLSAHTGRTRVGRTAPSRLVKGLLDAAVFSAYWIAGQQMVSNIVHKKKLKNGKDSSEQKRPSEKGWRGPVAR